jgi:hypothetical protein
MDLFIDSNVLFGSEDLFSPRPYFILVSTSPSRVDGLFLVGSAFFEAGDLWILLGYRVYSLRSAT